MTRATCKDDIEAMAYANTIARIIGEKDVREDLSIVDLKTILSYANAIASWARKEASSPCRALETEIAPKRS